MIHDHDLPIVRSPSVTTEAFSRAVKDAFSKESLEALVDEPTSLLFGHLYGPDGEVVARPPRPDDPLIKVATGHRPKGGADLMP